MKYRKLQIAFSATCLIACVLLIVLWVRSYGTWDRLFWTGKNNGHQLNSMLGHVTLVVAEIPKQPVPFYVARTPIEDWLKTSFDKNVLGFYFERTPSKLLLDVPFWFILLISMAIAAAPWIRQLRWRFSLRTMLIATTLVAVGLGAIVYSVR
jgi:hypothetical protein